MTHSPASVKDELEVNMCTACITGRTCAFQGVRNTFLKVKTRVLFVAIKTDCDNIINTIY